MVTDADNIQGLIDTCKSLLKRIEILEERVRDLQNNSRYITADDYARFTSGRDEE